MASPVYVPERFTKGLSSAVGWHSTVPTKDKVLVINVTQGNDNEQATHPATCHVSSVHMHRVKDRPQPKQIPDVTHCGVRFSLGYSRLGTGETHKTILLPFSWDQYSAQRKSTSPCTLYLS